MKTNIINILSIILCILAGGLSDLSATNRLYIDPFSISVGDDVSVPVKLENTDILYGLQAEITFPVGLEVEESNGEPDVSLAARTDDSFDLISNMIDGRTMRFGTFSFNHNCFSGSEGTLLYIKVKASEEFKGGVIEITKIIGSLQNDEDVEFPNTTSAVSAIIEAQKISLIQNNVVLKVGERINLEATVLPEDATDKTIEWSSEDESIAKVEAEGNVTAIGLGETIITARCGEVTAECRISVVATPVESIALNIESAELKVGESVKLEALVHPDDATVKTVEWSSADESIAKVDADGNVTAVSLGETVIIALSGNVSAECRISVVATPAESISLNFQSAEFKVGESIRLEATVLPYDATDKTIEWSSADESIAIVNADGNVTAVGLGETVIIALSGNVSAECRISVVATPAESISLNFQSAELKVGESIRLEATVLPDDATDKTVEWNSADESIAKVDAEGNVTAVSLGETVITARCGEVTAECRISVVATPVESIELNIQSTQLKVGESVKLEASVYPDEATDKTVEWNSADESIALVDADGNVTAVGLGETIITARCGEVTAECRISVVATPVEIIELNIQSTQLKVGESVKLEVLVLPDDATDKTIEWSSADESIAIVNADGNVTAISLGETVITARCGEVTAECRISVVTTPVESIALNIESIELKVGECVNLTATVLPDDATDKTVEWNSADESIAIVDADGNVTAVRLGETIITARCGEVTAECRISVVATPVESIALNIESAQLKVGEGVNLTATVLPEDATDKTIEWSSADESIAKVDSDGNVTAVGLGETVITARCGEFTAECRISVVATPVESIALNIESAQLKVGESISLEATVLPADATDKSITWTSSDVSVATVDAEGNVTAHSLGETVITATCGDVTAECLINVDPIIIEALEITPLNHDGEIGSRFHIDYLIMPEDATNKDVSFVSTDTNIAIVDEDGNVEIVGEGNCRIIVSTLDGSGITAECVICGLSDVSVIFNTTDSKISLYNMNGVIIKEDCTKEDLRFIKPGIYIIRIGQMTKTMILR